MHYVVSGKTRRVCDTQAVLRALGLIQAGVLVAIRVRYGFLNMKCLEGGNRAT